MSASLAMKALLAVVLVVAVGAAAYLVFDDTDEDESGEGTSDADDPATETTDPDADTTDPDTETDTDTEAADPDTETVDPDTETDPDTGTSGSGTGADDADAGTVTGDAVLCGGLVTFDSGTGLLRSEYETEWTVVDLLEMCYVKERTTWTEYTGYTETAASLYLSPGIYAVSVLGYEYEVVVPGELSYTSEWVYDLDGTSCAVSISYSVDVAALYAQRADSIAFNDGGGNTSFSNLAELVQMTSEIYAIEEALEAEFVRIGGDVSDQQGYADFLASFVQSAIDYPSIMTKNGSRMGEDYVPYGRAEYWARPLETLCRQVGDCEDMSALVCAIYIAAGYQTAMGGISGHVFAGVAIDGFEEVSEERRKALDSARTYYLACAVPVSGTCEGDLAGTVFYAVEMTHGQMHVGYLTSGTTKFGVMTSWGMAGFYPVTARSGPSPGSIRRRASRRRRGPARPPRPGS